MTWFKIEVLFAAWGLGSLLGALSAAKHERIGKMLPMAMLVGSGVVIVATVCIFFSHGTNNSVEELNQIMTELQNQAPK